MFHEKKIQFYDSEPCASQPQEDEGVRERHQITLYCRQKENSALAEILGPSGAEI